MKYIPGLNGLRAIAVFLVIFHHWNLPPLPGMTVVQYLIPDGRFGVNLFFVLSGFLITTILLIEKKNQSESSGGNKKVIVNFYIRRFLRIFPIYYLTIFVLYVCNVPEVEKNLPYYLTYTENFRIFFARHWDILAHTWSLAVEEQFYLLWPFIIIFSKKSWLVYILLFFIALGPAFSFFQSKFLPGFNAYILTPSCFDAFGIGALLAYCNSENKVQQIKKLIKILLPFAVLLFFYWKLAPSGGHFQYLRRTIDSIISCGLILFCLSSSFTTYRTKLLENKVMYHLGVVSYGIYLFHLPLPYFYLTTKKVFPISYGSQEPLINYIIMLIILLSIAFFSYYIIERPILSLKKRFRY